MAEINLDAARAARQEAESPSHTVTFRGETFDIPPEAPWGYLEAVMGGRNAKEIAFLAVRGILGDDYDRFVNLRPDPADAQELVRQASELWGMTEGEAEASGGSSSPTSSHSRPTSNGSTGSISGKRSGAKQR